MTNTYRYLVPAVIAGCLAITTIQAAPTTPTTPTKCISIVLQNKNTSTLAWRVPYSSRCSHMKMYHGLLPMNQSVTIKLVKNGHFRFHTAGAVGKKYPSMFFQPTKNGKVVCLSSPSRSKFKCLYYPN